MSRLLRIVLCLMLLTGVLPAAPAAAAAPLPPSLCQELPQANNEIYLICIPPNWWTTSNAVMVFAHGYVRPDAPMTQYYEQLFLDGQFLPNVANYLGYAFISTSYSKNGLAVKEGLADTLRLIQAFKSKYTQTGHVYLVGASEGGLIATLAAEQQTPSIAGGLALCGPIGSFRGQIDYWGDFRVLFDYFYPPQLPGIPVKIPARLTSAWDSVYVPQIAGLIGNPANQSLTAQLLNTSHAPIDPVNPSTVLETTVGILAYNVFATNEATDELGGQPFDNKDTLYAGSFNDQALNKPGGVKRFAADEAALQEISRYYETSGKLSVPLVTMHTTGDPIVPYWHETIYAGKALAGGSLLKYFNIPVVRYGHCTFSTDEAMGAFTALVRMANGLPPIPTP